MDEYIRLKLESSLIIIDRSWKTKLRGVYPYDFFKLVTGITSWLFWKKIPVADVEGDFCFIDSSFIRDYGYVLCKHRMQYDDISIGDINNALIQVLEPGVCIKLLQFMIKRIQNSKNEKAMKILRDLREYEQILDKDENDTSSIKKMIEYFMIDVDQLFCGPMVIVRGLKDVLLSSFVEPIADPLTVAVRKDLAEISFENDKVGGMTYFDTDSMYIIELDDVLPMHYPFDQHFEFAEIKQYDRYIDPDNDNEQHLQELKVLGSGKLNVKLDDIDSDWKEEDLEWKVVLEYHSKISNSNNLFVSYKPGAAIFDSVDDVILNICETKDFIEFFKSKGITVWSGTGDIKKIADIRRLREERDELQKKYDKLKKKNKSKK